MNTKVADGLSLAFIAVAAIVAIVLYPALPEQIPTHWNALGEVDDYTAKPWGVIILPLAALFAWLLMKAIPYMSPRGFRTDEFKGVINIFQLTIVGFLSLVAVLVLLEARGVNVYINNVVLVGVGLLFVVMGNYMAKLRKNFFIGIRTPWTLASDEVWARTHRLGGWLFILGGIAIVTFGFLRVPTHWMVATIITVALVPFVYSYLLYRRLEGFKPDEG